MMLGHGRRQLQNWLVLVFIMQKKKKKIKCDK